MDWVVLQHAQEKQNEIGYKRSQRASEGSVERLNRDIRMLHPKRTDFHSIDEKHFQSHIDLINFKPRACLNMKSPHNAFLKTGEFWQQKSVVQLLLESRDFA